MRLRTLVLFSLLAWFGGIAGALAAANDRVALLIGNAAYDNVTALTNPVNDATDLAAALERLGFAVTLVTDADFVEMHKALQDFSLLAQDADMALVYFAGHGIEIDKTNYLIPVDATLATDRRVMLETLSLDLVTEAVSGAQTLRMVLLDACRNNPFLGQMQVSDSGRSLGRGLSPFEPTGGTLVAFAAKGGTVALDGNGRNSPFMRGLLEHIEEPGLDVNLLFRKVRDAVLAETNNRQEPFTYGSLPGREIFLTPPVQVADLSPDAGDLLPVPTAPRGTEEEEFAWSLIEQSSDPAKFQQFIKTFPRGVHVDEAFVKLGALTTGTPGAATDATAQTGEPVQVADITDPRATVLPAVVEPVDLTPLVKSIQTELRRAGCNPGTADGIWGPKSRRALTAFGRDGKVEIASTEPSLQLLELLQSKPGTVCVQAAPRQQPRSAETTQRRRVEHEPVVTNDHDDEEDDHGGLQIGSDHDDDDDPEACFGFARRNGHTTFTIQSC